jgi:hypothetical protein
MKYTVTADRIAGVETHLGGIEVAELVLHPALQTEGLRVRLANTPDNWGTPGVPRVSHSSPLVGLFLAFVPRHGKIGERVLDGHQELES